MLILRRAFHPCCQLGAIKATKRAVALGEAIRNRLEKQRIQALIAATTCTAHGAIATAEP